MPLQCELSQQSFLPRRFPCVCLCASAAVTHACSAVAQWTACSVFQESSRRLDGHKAFSISRERINCSCPRVVLFASSQRSWRLSTFSLMIEDAVYCIVWPASYSTVAHHPSLYALHQPGYQWILKKILKKD